MARVRGFHVVLMLLAAGLASFGVPAARKGTPGPPGSGRTEVPLRLHPTGLLTLEARVNGIATQLVVDTGAGSTVFDEAGATRLALRMSTDALEGGASGAGASGLAIRSASGNRVQLADASWDAATAVVMDLSHVTRVFAEHPDAVAISGVLGSDFLAARNAVIDYRHRVLRFDR